MLNYTATIETSIRDATQKLEQEQQQLTTTLQDLEKQTPVTLSSLLASTTLAQQSVNECITRSAINAKNVQVLATAVLQIAADAGNIVNITGSQDLGTSISTHAKHTNELMDKTAYQAEQASLMGMESSIQASKLHFNGLLEKADSTAGKETIAELKTAFADIVALTQQLSSGTNKLTQQIKELAFQWVEAADAANSLETLIVRARAKNQLMLPELVDKVKELNADTENVLEPLLITLQSGYAANSIAMQTANIGVWIGKQLDRLT